MIFNRFTALPLRERVLICTLSSQKQPSHTQVMLSNPNAFEVHFAGKPYHKALPTIQDTRSPEVVLDMLSQNKDDIAPCYALTQSGGWFYGIQRGKKPVTGERKGNVIRVMGWLKMNNPHTPILEITVKPNGTGSLIECRFVRLESTEKWMNRLWPLSWPIDKLGSWLAKRDEPTLQNWLQNTLKTP
jgi:hypothetical protein